MFRIGEFSKIAQATVKQLRYYDEIGLFQPEHIDRFTSYRYYVASQLPDLHRIIAMKDLGLSLEQIKRFVVDEVSADELQGMLSLKKSQVEQELHEKVTQLKKIEARLQQVARDKEVAQDAVVLKEIPAAPFYGFRRKVSHLKEVRNYLMEMGKTLPNKIPKKKLSHLVAIQHADSFAIEDADVELGVMLHDVVDAPLQLTDGAEMQMGTLPRIELAACVIRLGGPDQSVGCFDLIGRWAETNGYELSGAVREMFIVPPQPGRFDETVTEIQLPVTLRESNKGTVHIASKMCNRI